MLLVGAALQDLRIISFWRTFGDLERAQWDELLECIALHNPSSELDAVTWHLESSGSFSTKSFYRAILPTPGPNELTVLGNQVASENSHLHVAMGSWSFALGHGGPEAEWSG